MRDTHTPSQMNTFHIIAIPVVGKGADKSYALLVGIQIGTVLNL